MCIRDSNRTARRCHCHRGDRHAQRERRCERRQAHRPSSEEARNSCSRPAAVAAARMPAAIAHSSRCN
eukprot:8217573-Alexandrium_andersonii.AAC.1